jgi:Calcineurin-like phosphoesterase
LNLYAISDLHLANAENRAALQAIPFLPNDWLAVVGDVGETLEHVQLMAEQLTSRFKGVIWTPGNHELWTEGKGSDRLRGRAKYEALVEICRRYGVVTPEDTFVRLRFKDETLWACPILTLYDYSYRPANISRANAVDWAIEQGVYCTDEVRLDPWPFGQIDDWCAERCRETELRLDNLGGDPTILIGHFPLREDLVWLPTIPRFSLWCGTHQTHDWHLRFNAKLVLSGHLHIPCTKVRDGVRFEEVSLGYPRQWMNRGRDAGRIRLVYS